MRRILFTLLALVSIACLFGSSNLINPDAQVATVDGRVIIFASLDSTVKKLKKESRKQEFFMFLEETPNY